MFFLKHFNKKINVLMSGNSVKDYSIAKKISTSPYLNNLYYWGKNKAILEFGENIGDVPTPEIKDFIKEKKIDLVIDQSEGELCVGTFDIFRYYYNIPTVGISKKWCQLESSKYFSKQFMQRNNILTPDFTLIESIEDYDKIEERFGYPVVIKQNSFFRGFGSFIAKNREEAIKIIDENLKNGHFDYKDTEGKNKLLIEKFITGKEVSQMLMWDGKTMKPFCPVRDYKREGNNNTGKNTGGMGAIAPIPLTDKEKSLLDEYIKQLSKALKKENAIDFTGIIYAGLMFSEDKLYTLEYNIRMGDPEAQVLIEHLDCDLLEIFYLLAKRKVNKINIKYKEGTALGVIIADKDYINNKLDTISRTIKLPKERNLTYLFNNKLNSNNEIEYHIAGRILTICNNDVKNPAPAIYKEIEKIQALNDNIYYRTDIGKEFLE